MKTQIVYVVVSSEKDLFLEELWVSAYSLRLHHPDATVKVLADVDTANRIRSHKVSNLITEVVAVETPADCTPMKKSRIIKTTIRNVIDGPFLYIDTDTVVCHRLDEVDSLTCDIAAVPDKHLSLEEDSMRNAIVSKVRNTLGVDISQSQYYFNSGVMFVADNERTRHFYKKWHEHWARYSIDGVRNADQPGLSAANEECGHIIQRLPDVFNCQLALSVRYFHDAYIVHFFHMDFIEDQSYSPFFGAEIYRQLKAADDITPEIDATIRNCKSAFTTQSMIVGQDQIGVLFSPTGQAYTKMMKRGSRMRGLLDWISKNYIRYHRLKKKIANSKNNK